MAKLGMKVFIRNSVIVCSVVSFVYSGTVESISVKNRLISNNAIVGLRFVNFVVKYARDSSVAINGASKYGRNVAKTMGVHVTEFLAKPKKKLAKIAIKTWKTPSIMASRMRVLSVLKGLV